MFTTHDIRTRHRALVRLSAGLLLTGATAAVVNGQVAVPAGGQLKVPTPR